MDGWRLLRIGWKKDPMDEEEMRIETREGECQCERRAVDGDED